MTIRKAFVSFGMLTCSLCLSGCIPFMIDDFSGSEGNVRVVNTTDTTLHIRFMHKQFRDTFIVESDVPPAGEFRWSALVDRGSGPRALISGVRDPVEPVELNFEHDTLPGMMGKWSMEYRLSVEGNRIKASMVNGPIRKRDNSNGTDTP